jgi:hypothetical protein
MRMVYYQGDKTTETPFLFWNKIPERITSIADLAKEKAICAEADRTRKEF